MKPTDEQIKALRKGDVVTVRAVVHCGEDAEGDVHLDMTWTSGRTWRGCVLPSEIMTIEPREINVGDRVREGEYEGEVKAICDGRAWVRFDFYPRGKTAPFMSDCRTKDLERLT